MNWQNWLFWGVLATFAQLLFEGATQFLRLTRMSLPYMLGTIFTSKSLKGKNIGICGSSRQRRIFHVNLHRCISLLGGPTWWRGGLIGVAQAAFVLVVGMPLLPEFHPRMASERYGPTAMLQLEPPGFLALNYGPRTPISIFISHIIFGTVIGSFCHM